MAWPEIHVSEEHPARAGRVVLSSPVLIYGRGADENAFHDLATIIALNAHGGVLSLSANVRRGQTILLLNEQGSEECGCRVVYVGPDHADGSKKVVFEFVSAMS